MTAGGMTAIRETVTRGADVINRLGARSEEIGKILTVITEVTDQTSLLALNAAILAAQAGEYGKGFAVVADEIKELAERTANSTKEIEDVVEAVRREAADAVRAMEEGVKKTEGGVRLSLAAGRALETIVAVIATSSIERSGSRVVSRWVHTPGAARTRASVLFLTAAENLRYS